MLFSCEDWVGGSGGCIFEQGVSALATEEIRGLVGYLVSSLWYNQGALKLHILISKSWHDKLTSVHLDFFFSFSNFLNSFTSFT